MVAHADAPRRLKGLFDIEVIGPRMSADGTEAGLTRCINKLHSLVESAESSRAS